MVVATFFLASTRPYRTVCTNERTNEHRAGTAQQFCPRRRRHHHPDDDRAATHSKDDDEEAAEEEEVKDLEARNFLLVERRPDGASDWMWWTKAEQATSSGVSRRASSTSRPGANVPP
mmetsp:Transcript_4454/g.13939  ORF Transcript_4454/g.13939 Transcript_4454/m.13939 type:complete len:118 (-) Transcript_4454:1038-1391(-)